MDKSKETNKRVTSDCKKVGISKAILKNNHIAIKSGSSRKISYISRAKNVSIPFDKKYNIYTTDTKSFLKQTCDKCRLGTSSHLFVNTASVTPPTQLATIDPGSDLNGNLSFNPHAAFCNFPTVAEVPNFSLSYQAAQQHYELSVQKSTKHKQRAQDKRTFNSKFSSSKVPFRPNKLFSPLSNSNIGYQNTRSAASNLSNTVPFIQLSSNRICSDAIMRENYSSKCFIKPDELVNEQVSNEIKVANFPVFSQTNLPNKTCFTFQVNQEKQLRSLKKSDYFIQKWQQISVASLFENSKDLKDTDKMIFPALPSNKQNEQTKPNICSTSNITSELAFEVHSELESANSVSEVITSSESIVSNVSPIIPQASYADVIRMSATCSNSVIDSSKISEIEQNLVLFPEKKEENSQSGSSDWVISRLSQLDQKTQEPTTITLTHLNPNIQNSVTPHPIVVSLEKPSFYNSSLQNNKGSSTPLTPLSPSERGVKGDDSINNIYSFEETVDKMSSSSSAYSSSIPSDFVANAMDGQALSSKPDSMYSSASSVNSANNAFKPVGKKNLNKDCFQNKSPVIIMNNCSPPENMFEITFGIEYDEMIKLCSDDCDVGTENTSNIAQNNDSTFSKSVLGENTLEKATEVGIFSDEKSTIETKLDREKTANNRLFFKEKELYWKDSDVNYNQNNHIQLTKYFASLWKECDRSSSSGLKQEKIQIYQES